ncbi:hypothetical protein B0A54_05123 [Friedmanniomyces endolithicus]|uniref:Uncharacterized protein n=1 Tax=Friedmanniomyces endolithicus TaxID=329885 RepID=A0A4V5N8N7_9PEZI|nr:hypothetical protein B0A54_05123 [Friedmanniomyces endolithicus]
MAILPLKAPEKIGVDWKRYSELAALPPHTVPAGQPGLEDPLKADLRSTMVSHDAEEVADAPGAALELTLDKMRQKRPSSIKEHFVALANEA